MFSWEICEFFRSNHPTCFMKKAVLKNFCNVHRKDAGLQLYQKETPTQMFSSEYCEIIKNYFEKRLLMAPSDLFKQLQKSGEQLLLYWLFF